jgi:hypothetical protein
VQKWKGELREKHLKRREIDGKEKVEKREESIEGEKGRILRVGNAGIGKEKEKKREEKN